ncbi:hypothetical protein EK21DRAFT_118381 [Setomelanomma holmii]|uniref:Uncharacterized protein n=1 Tax=Setomelanomma holmii TaxID=210430 RepID=A0A9P4GXL4_9PLEO|nr:hypothetical protein EK21DRAFT_118381 [Setomelanomma holmii]
MVLFDQSFDFGQGILRPYLGPGVQAHFDISIDQIEPLTKSLEHLQIIDSESRVPNYFDYVSPVTTLVHFENPRVFHIAYELLVSRPQYGRLPIEDLLPEKLEVLFIERPQVGITTVLDEILHFKAHSSTLRQVELYPRNDRGDDCETFKYKFHDTWQRLEDADICF